MGADPATQTIRGMAERVAVMKRVWAGEKTTDSMLPVGPSPVQSGGPPLFVGSIGPKTVRSAAAWADVGVALREFEKGSDGFTGPCELVVAVGTK